LIVNSPFKLIEKGLAWEDLIIEPTARLLSPSTPLFREFTNDGEGSMGVHLYHFDSYSEYETELFFSVQMPHKWARTQIRPHVHWSPKITSDNGENVIWGLEYTWAGVGQIFNETSKVFTSPDTPRNSVLIGKKHYLSSFTPIEPIEDEFGLSSILLGRLYRNTKNELDTYKDSACLLYVDIHYELNRLGSEEELGN